MVLCGGLRLSRFRVPCDYAGKCEHKNPHRNGRGSNSVGAKLVYCLMPAGSCNWQRRNF